jgi:hypothetical protein
LVYEALERRVGTKAGAGVKAEAGKVPFRTWYDNRAATTSGIVPAAIPAVELRNLAKAALLGARMVMFDAELRAVTIAGWLPSRALDRLVLSH